MFKISLPFKINIIILLQTRIFSYSLLFTMQFTNDIHTCRMITESSEKDDCCLKYPYTLHESHEESRQMFEAHATVVPAVFFAEFYVLFGLRAVQHDAFDRSVVSLLCQ